MRRLLPTLTVIAGCNAPDPAPKAPARSAPETTASTGAPATYSLDGHTWEDRLLLVFAPTEGEALRAHRARWSDTAAPARERDLVRIEVVGDAVKVGGEVVPASGRGLRERFEPEGPLTVVVVGKDGTEKRRGPSLSPEEVFAAIDAMPMRRREMAQEK